MKAIIKINRMKTLAIAIIIGLASLTNIKAADNSEIKNESTEENIKIENWMSDLSAWEIHEALKVDKEAEIELEDWMLDPSDKSWDVLQKVDKEEEMPIEDWMTNLKKWK